MALFFLCLISALAATLLVHRYHGQPRLSTAPYPVASFTPRPVAEVESQAEKHLVNQQYKRAEKTILEALSHDSSSIELKTKLLETYFLSGNSETFVSAATSFHSSLSQTDKQWHKIVSMGRKCAPANPMFAEPHQ